jgi:hypothetical protein
MKKKKSSKNSKKIEKLKLKVKELELANKKLKEKNRKLQVQKMKISKHSYKWYQQKKTFKAKYQRSRVLYAARASTNASSQTRDMSDDE